MSTKTELPAVSAIVLITVSAGVGTWWFTQSTNALPQKTALAPMPVKAGAPAIDPHVAQVELPKLPPATSTAVDAAPMSTDPQADLKTAIPDIVRLMRANDLMAFEKTYDPPGTFDPVKRQESDQRVVDDMQKLAAMAAQHPEMQQQIQQLQNFQQQVEETRNESWQALVYQTPTYNAAGDEATYVFVTTDPYPAVPGTAPVPIKFHKVFIKINGKWYFKGDAP